MQRRVVVLLALPPPIPSLLPIKIADVLLSPAIPPAFVIESMKRGRRKIQKGGLFRPKRRIPRRRRTVQKGGLLLKPLLLAFAS